MRKIQLFKQAAGVFLAAAFAFVPSLLTLAAGSNYDTDIGGTKTISFDQYLVLGKTAEVPSLTFSYEITAGTAITYNAEGKTFEVLAGISPDAVTVSDVSFAKDDACLSDENSMVKGYDKENQKYAKKSVTVDFQSVVFPEPGVYRYVVTQKGTVLDDEPTRVIDVYVNDATEGAAKKLTIGGYVLHSNTEAPSLSETDGGTTGAYAGVKSQGFTSIYNCYNVTVKMEVEGNQASKDKYFEFTLNLTDAKPGTYQVDLSKADPASGENGATRPENTNKTNPTTITVGDDGTATTKFYLQHSQELSVKALFAGTSYTFSEDKEDYICTAPDIDGYMDPITGTITDKDIFTSFVNTRKGIIPTGVAMTIAPFAILTAIGGLGIFIILRNRKHG